MVRVIVGFILFLYVLPPIIAPFIGIAFFLSLGNPIFATLLLIFGILYLLNILDARRDVPRHFIELIRFAKEGTPIKIKRWMFYYNFDRVVKKLRERELLTPLKISEVAFEIYSEILELSKELESSFEDIMVSLEQISTSVSQISRAFSDVVSRNMSEIYSAWMDNKVRAEEGVKFLEGNFALFEDMGFRFGEFLKSLKSSEVSVKGLLQTSRELRDIGKFISALSYQISLESVKYRNSANISKMVEEMKILSDSTREITIKSIENLEELNRSLTESIGRLEGIGFEGVIMGAREIGKRFEEIEDSVNRMAQEAGLVSRTVEDASASLIQMGIAVEEINVAVKDLMGDVSYIKRTAEDIRGIVERLKEMFSVKSGEYGGGRWIIWAYGAFLFSFSAILILGGYILWKNGMILPSLLLYAGGIDNLIKTTLLCLTSESYIFSVLENKPRFEVGSLYVPMGIAREYINREFYEKPKREMEVLILSLNSLLDKVRETFVSIKEINLQISQISTAVRQISKSFEEVLKPSMDELKALSEQALKSSQNGYQITLENIGDFEKKVEELGRIISNLERVSEIAKNLSENVEGLSRIIEKINLVSINATVEAYKMGEGGPFEVVSREIRGLSEKSNLIIESINKGMEEIRSKIEGIMKERDWWEGNLEGIRERARGIVDVFGEISERIEKSDEMVRAIAQALYESASAVKETYISLENIDRMVIRMSENLGQISERTSRILDEVKKAYAKA